ncbi:MAG: hypothetical protein IIU30_07380, partial [Treponema sp.]|nr:hypothetical protein [Treponema sp.]
GAGAQKEIFVAVIRKLLPAVKAGKAALFINVGDHDKVWHELVTAVPQMKPFLHEHFDDFGETARFFRAAYDGEARGIHAFCHT